MRRDRDPAPRDGVDFFGDRVAKTDGIKGFAGIFKLGLPHQINKRVGRAGREKQHGIDTPRVELGLDGIIDLGGRDRFIEFGPRDLEAARPQRSSQVARDVARSDVHDWPGVPIEFAGNQISEAGDIATGAGYEREPERTGGLGGGIADREHRHIALAGGAAQCPRTVSAGQQHCLNAGER